MKREKKIIRIVTLILLLAVMSQKVEVKAAVNSGDYKMSVSMASVSVLGQKRIAVQLYRFDDAAISGFRLINADMFILYKKNTPTPTTIPKKSSEKKEDGGEYGVGGFVVLVILAIAYFKSQKKRK